MNINEIYKEQLSDLYEAEIRARDSYKEFIERISDEELKKKLNFIFRDEEEHVKIMDELYSKYR